MGAVRVGVLVRGVVLEENPDAPVALAAPLVLASTVWLLLHFACRYDAIGARRAATVLAWLLVAFAVITGFSIGLFVLPAAVALVAAAALTPVAGVLVPHPFREAVERADLDAAVALLADDVVFRSPAVFKPYEGRETVATILRTVFGVFEDFRYTDELEGEGVHGLIFEARVGERSLQGLDLLRPAADGRIAEFTVMVRPASGLIALAERMGPALEAAGV